MKSRKPVTSFAPQEIQGFVLPLILASICILLVLITEAILSHSSSHTYLIVYAIFGIIYLLTGSALISRTANFRDSYGWAHSAISGIGLGMLPYLLPDYLNESAQLLVVLGALVIATVSGRYHAYLTLIAFTVISLPHSLPNLGDVGSALEFFAPLVLSIIVLEAIVRLKDTTQQHIHRLETINKISRQIMLSLDTEQTISLLNATIQDALEADTYFVGIVKGDDIQLDLFYDDGEYFNGTRVPLEGTLSGWVIKNQKELFLPDLRWNVKLEGVEMFVIGKEKTSLSWMGVPLKAANVTGIMALGSYEPNAFDQADMELLSNLAQHVALALDNTIQHAKVEEQARLDSMTGVYNHGYFLKRLAEQAEESLSANTPLSLIMLDIDYFKQYNDTFGHLVGDRILNSLCTAIKQHIKQADAVGRWGGEEFIISLPGASGAQAVQIAQRISQTMAALRVENMEQKTIPIPTVSQGIAIFPLEADEIYRLIDLADRRLYIAKERGRNQVEPDASHWEKIQAETITN